MLFYCNAKFNFLYGTMYSGSNYFFTTTKKTIFHKLLEKNKNNNKLFKKKKKEKIHPAINFYQDVAVSILNNQNFISHSENEF